MRSRDDTVVLQSVVNQQTPTVATYTVLPSDDIVLSGPATSVIFPVAAHGREIQVVQTTATNVIIVLATGDTIFGQTTVTMTQLGMSLRFKATLGGWILI